jgi:plasmid rolling circle replication initiator protein Rep
MEKHINKIAIGILKDEYSDYPENDWHYNREYRMLVKAQDKVKKLNIDNVSVSFENSCKQCGVELDKKYRFCSGACKAYYER